MNKTNIKKIGIEDEYLITNTKGTIPSQNTVISLFESLKKIGFKESDGNYLDKKGNIITKDSGYALIEFIFPPYEFNDLEEMKKNKIKTTLKVIKHFKNQGYLLLAGTTPNKIKPEKLDKYVTKKSRAELFLKIMPKTEYFRFFGPATHINISFNNNKSLVNFFNIINAISGLFILLSARQKLWLGEDSKYQSCREYSWKANGKEIKHPERNNFFPTRLNNISEIKHFLFNQPVIFFNKEKELIVPKEKIAFSKYLKQTQLVTDKYSKEKVKKKLNKVDINDFLRSFWHCTRLKYINNDWLLEIRTIDTQKVGNFDAFLNLVLFLYTINNDLTKYINSKTWKEWEKLYWNCLKYGLNSKKNKQELTNFIDLLEKKEYNTPELFTTIIKESRTQADKIYMASKKKKILLEELKA